ncbi:MAG: hypothetical protein HKO98_14625 [Gemmatimonadetes bacterium]|nr:hypothetical protein [Gemmatimonadota bacterium]
MLGKGLGIERILVRGRTARLNFLGGVVPRLQAFQGPLTDRQVSVEVRRMAPLSLALTRHGAEPLTDTLIQALTVLSEQQEPLVASKH